MVGAQSIITLRIFRVISDLTWPGQGPCSERAWQTASELDVNRAWLCVAAVHGSGIVSSREQLHIVAWAGRVSLSSVRPWGFGDTDSIRLLQMRPRGRPLCLFIHLLNKHRCTCQVLCMQPSAESVFCVPTPHERHLMECLVSRVTRALQGRCSFLMESCRQRSVQMCGRTTTHQRYLQQPQSVQLLKQLPGLSQHSRACQHGGIQPPGFQQPPPSSNQWGPETILCDCVLFCMIMLTFTLASTRMLYAPPYGTVLIEHCSTDA